LKEIIRLRQLYQEKEEQAKSRLHNHTIQNNSEFYNNDDSRLISASSDRGVLSVVGSRQGVSIIHDREMTTIHDRGVSMAGAGHNAPLVAGHNAPLVAGHNAPLMAGHYAPITGHNASLMMNHQSFNSELSSEDQGYAGLLSDQRLLGGMSKVQPVGASNAAAAAHGPMKYSAFNHQQQHQVAAASAYDSYHARDSTQFYYGNYTTKLSSLQ